MREVTVLLEDNERITLVTTHVMAEFADWTGPLEMRVIQDPYRDDYAEVEFKKTSTLNRVMK